MRTTIKLHSATKANMKMRWINIIEFFFSFLFLMNKNNTFSAVSLFFVTFLDYWKFKAFIDYFRKKWEFFLLIQYVSFSSPFLFTIILIKTISLKSYTKKYVKENMLTTYLKKSSSRKVIWRDSVNSVIFIEMYAYLYN